MGVKYEMGEPNLKIWALRGWGTYAEIIIKLSPPSYEKSELKRGALYLRLYYYIFFHNFFFHLLEEHFKKQMVQYGLY